jgi:hypothetical protein
VEVVALVELLALAGLAVQTWKGAWWGRWGIAVLLVGTRVVYARELTEVAWPASAWRRSGSSEPG